MSLLGLGHDMMLLLLLLPLVLESQYHRACQKQYLEEERIPNNAFFFFNLPDGTEQQNELFKEPTVGGIGLILRAKAASRLFQTLSLVYSPCLTSNPAVLRGN